MEKIQKGAKTKKCCNRFCEKPGEYFEDGESFCLVHFLLNKKKVVEYDNQNKSESGRKL